MADPVGYANSIEDAIEKAKSRFKNKTNATIIYHVDNIDKVGYVDVYVYKDSEENITTEIDEHKVTGLTTVNYGNDMSGNPIILETKIYFKRPEIIGEWIQSGEETSARTPVISDEPVFCNN